MVLRHGKLHGDGFVRVVFAVQIDREGVALVINALNCFGQRFQVFVIPVRDAQIDPVERAVLLIVQDLPFDVVEHGKGGVVVHVHGDGKVQDLVGRCGLCLRSRKKESDEQGGRKQQGFRGLICGFHQQYLLKGHSPVIADE